MKTSIILLSALSMTMASFKNIQSEDHLTKATVLFPSLEEFLEIMDRNSAFYGPYLKEAKEEFEVHYTKEVLPELNQSFKSVIAQGIKSGIDWSTIKLVAVEFSEEHKGSASHAVIAISSNGKEYKLEFEKALFINGEWKVSQSLKFI
jgi:hypothetical protein